MKKIDRKVDKLLILSLIKQGSLKITNDVNPQIVKEGLILKQRRNKRRRSNTFDYRVDICTSGKVMGINVSHLIWMNYHKEVIPNNFTIHHIDENSTNNLISNLIAIHKNDHYKLHIKAEEDVPF